MKRVKKKSAKNAFLSLIINGVAVLAILFLILVVLGFALYNFSSSSSNQYNAVAQNNIQIVKGIVEEYHQTHTYSQPDFFVCSDMAIDVWNMVKSKGINAQIEVGNIDNPNVNFTEYNHAWVLAEVEPLTWLALETTGGYVVYNNTNYLYYRGFSFSTPAQFKSYLDVLKEYNNQLELINKTQGEYNQCTKDYETLRLNYNQNYVGRPVTTEGIQARDQVAEKLGECNALSSQTTEEAQSLSNIISELKGLIT
jgi:hypothetical protein